jgi:hypothetical protein
MEILVRRETEDQKLAEGATFLDDLDLIVSPRDGLLMMVAVKGGQHVCQQCGGLFDENDPRLRSAEVSLAPGSPRLKLHSRCQSASKQYNKVFRGLEIRRAFARAAKASGSLAQTALDSAKKIVGG